MPPDVVVSNAQVYEVTITTKFVVPNDGKKLTGLGVWHALPNARPWDGLGRTMGASAITYEPKSGRIQHFATNESQNVFWEMRQGLTPDRTLDFVSRFRVRSADRTYDLKKSTATWSDYQHNLDVVTPSVDENLDAIVDEIRSRHSPAEAALEFCKWVTEHIKYDASVPYHSRDLHSILIHQKGHCGHQMTTFEAMCVCGGDSHENHRGIEPEHARRDRSAPPDSTRFSEPAHLGTNLSAWLRLGRNRSRHGCQGVFFSSASHPEQHRLPELRHLDV